MAEIRKFYTVEEANRILPELTAILQQMQGAKEQILAHRDELEQLEQVAASNGHAQHAEELTAQLDALVRLLNNRLERLNDASIELRDLDDGLLDFPSLRGTRMIWLCWKLGELQVAFWHELNTGFTSRQKL
ncbi:MAG: DUF2203 domain-containing protein [Candidatus Chloroheliales bacterium]|nr:MAG: DUF2203 domain-containing protein [Chloroflexota bacterium]